MELYKHSPEDVKMKVNGLKLLLDTIQRTSNPELVAHYIDSARELSKEIHRELSI